MLYIARVKGYNNDTACICALCLRMKVNMHIIMHVGYRMSMYRHQCIFCMSCMQVCKYALALVSTCVHTLTC